MNLFLSDLMADLREKRLLPVALLLVVALVAVPVVLAKPFEAPAPLPPDQTAQESLPDAASDLIVASDFTGKGSALDLFDPRDPFRPPEAITKREGTRDSAARTSDTAAGPSTSDAGSAGGDSGGGDTGGSGGGDTGGGGTGVTPSPPVTRTSLYTYVIDVTFRANTRTRRVKGMRRLDMLPSQRSPLLIFMGVGAGGNNAVFLVDSTLQGFGEGRCRPSSSDCSFLYLGAGSEHQFNNDEGDSYILRVDQIRRVKVRASGSRRSRGAGRGSRASGGRRFVPPSLVDQVDVARTESTGSSDEATRR
jgi:hypothetical protein